MVTFFLFIAIIYGLFWLIGALLILRKSYDSLELEKPYEVGISIIIAAKNELENLKKNLPYFLNLNYEKYEIIIVVNNSNDDSYGFLLSQKNHKLNPILLEQTPKGISPKKFALTYGIQHSIYDYLVFSDADCIPLSKEWLNFYNQSFQNQNDIVIGVSPYCSKKNFLNRFIQWETFFTGFLYVTAVLMRIPYMAVGRNWGMKKEVFYKENGFHKHLGILSGDDDLFIQNLENNYRFDVLIHPLSQTISEPKHHWKEYLEQKKRHLSVSKYYQLKTQFLLFMLNFLIITYYFSWIYIIFFGTNQILLLSLCMIFITKLISIKLLTKVFQMKITLIYCILGELILILFQLIVLPLSFLKPIKWK